MIHQTRICGLLTILALALVCPMAMADFGSGDAGVISLDFRPPAGNSYSAADSIAIHLDFRPPAGSSFSSSTSGTVSLDLRRVYMKYSDSASFAVITVPAADINRDGGVDVVDLLWLVDAFGSLMGDVNYMITSDFNSDGYVDVVDLLIFVENFGT
jgi:hypothetical protein